MIAGYRNRLGRTLLLTLCLSLLLVVPLVVLPGLGSGDPTAVTVFIHGPEKLATNETAQFTVEITGGPTEGYVNWSYEARIDGEIGAEVSPEMGNASINKFLVNVSAGQTTGKLDLVVNGTVFNETQVNWSGDVPKEIEVFEPIVVNISANIRNSGVTHVEGAVIDFYVDDEYIGNRTVDVPANETVNVYMVWITSRDDEGEHEVEVRINEDGALLEFENGDNIMNKIIYIGERPDRELKPIMIFNSGLVIFIEIMAILMFIMAFLMRRQTLRGRSYYSPRATYASFFFGFLFILLSFPTMYVSQVLEENPEVSGDPTGLLIHAIFIFILGFGIIIMTWDRTRKKRR